MTVGITFYNWKHHIPTDLPLQNQFIPPQNNQSQDWLDSIDEWTENQKMVINEKKTKTILFNYTSNYQFTTRLLLKNEPSEVIDSTRLLGTIISNDLSWDQNISKIVKNANARMELVRRVASFGTPVEDIKNIYILFVRSILEQSATVWHSSLTQENINDLERVQKSAIKVILQENYSSYKQGVAQLNIESLASRRELKCVKSEKLKHMFPLNEKSHEVKTRHEGKYKVQFSNTESFQKSSIIYVQKLLNENQQSAVSG